MSRRPLWIVGMSIVVLAGGCARFEQRNREAWLPTGLAGHDDGHAAILVKTCYLYPVRNWLTAEPLVGRAAADLDDDGSVPDGSFWAHRDVASLTGRQLERGAVDAPPRPPFTVGTLKGTGGSGGFFGSDATGRRFLFKFDCSEWPEQGTAAEVIASRVYWAMGYRVPANSIVRVEGTGNEVLDGRRAMASEFVPGRIRGKWKFDWFRHRREVRAMRLVAAWLNDMDRVDTNTLLSVVDGKVYAWLLDFNSTLGTWQGRPREPWRGWRHRWDVEWQLVGAATLGTVRPGYNPECPVASAALGRLDDRVDPAAWRGQWPNTAFDRMDAADAAWMSARMARLKRWQIEAMVRAGRFSDSSDAERLTDWLMSRRDAIFKCWPPRAPADGAGR